MACDPIVEEIHRIRRQLLEECGGDLHGYFERLKELAAAFPNPRVSTTRRRGKSSHDRLKNV